MRSFKIESELNAPLSTVAHVELDPNNYDKWYYQVIESRLLKATSSTEFYTYIRYNSPGGLPDRDTVLQTIIQPYTKKTGYMQLTIRGVEDFIPVTAGVVRIAALDMIATFKPIADGKKTNLEIVGYMDPGGFAPIWAVNFVQRTTPLTTIIGLQRMLLMPQYSSSTFSTPFKYTE